MKRSALILTVLAVSTFASAGMRFDLIRTGAIPGMPGYSGYKLVATSLTGHRPNFFEGSFTGPMLQVGKKTWEPNPAPGRWVMEYSPTIPALAGCELFDAWYLDSHFLVPDGAETPLGLPTETNDFSLGKEPLYDYFDMGIGTYMGGEWGHTGTGTTWEMAYLVVRDGDYVDISGSVVDSAGVEYEIFIFPEPATMALLGFGGLLALRRRR